MNEIRKALETIADAHAVGQVSDDILVKACDAYKAGDADFNDDYYYQLCVAKSVRDHLNDIEQSEEILKAVLPGQTKVVDGVVYIYTATPNAKTQYDWRVFKGKSRPVGRPVDANKASAKQAHVNSLFPADLKGLKVVNANIGGSTGAQLVEDANGNQYVMKRGKNTSNGHVKSEYLTNQLYDLLGVRVPDFELYDDGGDAVLLSRFIPGLTNVTSKDNDELAKGFAVDALLANWDVYNNDNAMKDAGGRIVRVDNGSGLEYRAQGGKKTFGASLPDWDSMMRYNGSIVAGLTDTDYVAQIDAVLAKRQDIVDYLKAAGEDALATTMDQRLNAMKKIGDGYRANIAATNRTVLPRNLKADADMYKTFTADELKDFWSNAPGSRYYDKLHDHYASGTGWTLLGSICQERGFDARPKVVDDDEYWNAVTNSPYQILRGLDAGSRSKNQYADEFKYDDTCFWGTTGIHGAGIYFHVNDGTRNKDKTKTGYKQSDAYKNARGYAGRGGVIVDAVLDPSAKVALVPDLKAEIKKMIQVDTPAALAKKAEVDQLQADYDKVTEDLRNVTHVTEEKVKADMHWDQHTLVDMTMEIDNTDWGAIDDEGNPDYPAFDVFFPKIEKWVKDNGGKITERGKGTDIYELTVPNSKNKFTFSRFQYENGAIKRKHAFAPAYNLPVKRFQQWLETNHYAIITKAVEKAKENIGDAVNKLRAEQGKAHNALSAAMSDLKSLQSVKDPNATIWSGIYEDVVNNGRKEAIGVYAALKGYDAIIEPHGNGGPNSFMIVLNRSKVIVRK